MPTNENLSAQLVANILAAGYTPRTPDEWVMSAVDYLHTNATTPSTPGAADFATLAGEPYDNAAMAAIFQTATSTTVAALVALGSGAVVGTWYKITNAAAAQNPDAHPIYIRCEPDSLFEHCIGLMYIPNPDIFILDAYHPVKYSLAANIIAEITIVDLNVFARTGVITVNRNCVAAVIKMIGNAAGGSQVYDLYFDNCTCLGWNFNPDDDFFLMYSLRMQPESSLTVGSTELGFPYYLDLWWLATVVIGDGITAEGDFYYGRATITYEAGTDSYFDNRYYQGVTAVIPSTGNGYSFRDLKKFESNISIYFDAGADTTPDMQSVNDASAGIITYLTCTAPTITITEFQNLKNNYTYDVRIDTGKTITLDNGTYFKLLGGVDFIGNGSVGDKILMKTNGDNTAAYEVYRNNY